MSKTLNIGMIGYGFMGRAHSNAFLQVSRFFEREPLPVLKVCSGRDEEKLRAFAASRDLALFPVSAATTEGIRELVGAMKRGLDRLAAP